MTTKEINVDELLNSHTVPFFSFFTSHLFLRKAVPQRPIRIPKRTKMMMVGMKPKTTMA